MADGKETEVYEMLLAVVRSIVDRPDEVKILIIPNEGSTTFRIMTNPQDAGQVIGKQGRTARSIRTIVGANGMRLKRTFVVDIVNGRDQT